MSEGPASGFHPQTKHCSLLDLLLPFRLFRLFFFNVWTGDSTSFISYAKRLLLMGVGLKSEIGSVAGGRIVGRGSRVRYMGGT